MCIVWLSAYAANHSFLEFDNVIKIRWICGAPNNNTVLQIGVHQRKVQNFITVMKSPENFPKQSHLADSEILSQ